MHFLEFVDAELEDSQKEYDDPFVTRLQENIRQIKSSRVMEERFMVLKEMLQKERREGYIEGQKEGQKQILMSQVQKKIEKEKSIEQIADELEEEVSVISQIYNELMEVK